MVSTLISVATGASALISALAAAPAKSTFETTGATEEKSVSLINLPRLMARASVRSLALS